MRKRKYLMKYLIINVLKYNFNVIFGLYSELGTQQDIH